MKNGNLTVQILCCENSSCEIEKLLAGSGKKIRLTLVPCSGRIEPIHILKAFETGADGVVVIACEPSSCLTAEGSARIPKRVEYAKKLLAEAGVDPKMLVLIYNDSVEKKIADLPF